MKIRMDNQDKQITRREVLIASTVGMVSLASKTAPVFAQQSQASSVEIDATDQVWKEVAAVFGVQGTVESGNVLLIDLPRTEIHPVAFGIPLHTEIGFDTEITFQHAGTISIVKYEFILLDNEVMPVLKALFAQNLQPSTTVLNALHNHFIELTPKIKFLHGTSIGDPVKIAHALREVLSHSGQRFVSSSPGNTGLPDKEIEKVIGGVGTTSGGVLSITVERKEKFRELGIALESSMQLEAMFNFQSIGKEQAVVIAEFVLLPSEVDAVARTLQGHGFSIMALHNHELFIQPTLYYLHSFHTGSSLILAQAIRNTLNKTNSLLT